VTGLPFVHEAQPCFGFYGVCGDRIPDRDPFASAGEYGTRDEAVAMVKRVEDMFSSPGANSTFKAVSDKRSSVFTIATSTHSFTT